MEAQESFWINPIIKIGTVKSNKVYNYIYQGLPTMPDVARFHATCGCTSLRYDTEGKELKVTYKSGKFPNHIEGDSMGVNKPIIVQYKNGTEEALYLQGTKLR